MPGSMSSMNATFANEASSFPSNASSETIIAVTVINAVIIVVTTLGNLLVLIVVFINIRFITVSNILIANLASIDLLTAAVVIPGDIYRTVCSHVDSCHVGKVVETSHRTFVHFAVTAAASSLFIIAIDRFIAIAYPMKYTSVLTKTRAVGGVITTWILGAIVTAIFNGLNIVYIQNSLCIFLILVMFVLYAYIFSIALKHERRIAAMQITYQRKASIFPWERKSAQTMAIILGVFAASWVPTVVFYSVVAGEGRNYPEIRPWIGSIYYLNSALDPFIYCIRSERFRRSVRRLRRT